MLFTPDGATDGCEGVGEGRRGLGVSGSGVGGSTLAGRQAFCQQCDDGEQGQQARGGAGDGEVGPLTLGLDAEMGSRFLEGGLDAPAPDELGDDVLGRAIEIGAQERLSGRVGLLHGKRVRNAISTC